MNKLNIKKAATALRQGGVIAYPTEAVFGLGCDPMNQSAVRKILQLKNRPEHKGLILVAASFGQLEPYLDKIEPEIYAKIICTWPGPVNWLLPANPAAPQILRGKFKTQAVRVSSHPLVRALCREFGGAIVSTSANLSGRPAATSALKVRARFHHQLDYLLAGETGKQNKPCEIRHALSDQIVRTAN